MVKSNISIEGARIVFRNFSGKAGKFNAEGNRNFCVLLEEDLARTLENDGWNVRWLKPKDENETPQGYLQVAVAFNNIPPTIVIMSSRGKTKLDGDNIGILDWAEIESVDLIIRPYNWVLSEGTKNEKRGVKGYIKSMYIKIVEDEFEQKYRNVPDSGTDVIGGCGNCDTCDGNCDNH